MKTIAFGNRANGIIATNALNFEMDAIEIWNGQRDGE